MRPFVPTAGFVRPVTEPPRSSECPAARVPHTNPDADRPARSAPEQLHRQRAMSPAPDPARTPEDIGAAREARPANSLRTAQRDAVSVA